MLLFETYAEHYFALEGRRATLLRDMRGLLRIFRARECRRVLDLGCGTGEHAAVLNRAGIRAFGIDRSRAMIAVARKRFPELNCVVADITNSADVRDFTRLAVEDSPEAGAAGIDAAFSLFGTFNYLQESDALLNALRSVAGVLSAGGVFVLEVWNPEAYRNLPPEVPVAERTIYDGDRVIRRGRKVRIDPAAADYVAIEHRYEIRADSSGGASPSRSESEQHRLRLYSASELEGLAFMAGLRLRATHADLSARPVVPSSAGLLLIFEKESAHVRR
jgi:SAM-dependent methyltransferase